MPWEFVSALNWGTGLQRHPPKMCPPTDTEGPLCCVATMAADLKFDSTLVPRHASVKGEGRRCSFEGKDGTALFAPATSGGSVRTLALIIKRDGDYSSQVGMAPPSADVDVGLHKQDGICLWSGNVYINGTRKRIGFDAGTQPLLVWRTGGECTLSVYAGEDERVQLPVPAGATHFAVSGDVNGVAEFEIDDRRSEAAQCEAEKGEDALDEWLRDEAEGATAAAKDGGGCCLIT